MDPEENTEAEDRADDHWTEFGDLTSVQAYLEGDDERWAVDA